ncbi:MAG: twin-arginine translocase subunit TatC [Anaerolineae bacterium]|jgi:sec-independent protein translocase protein TatC|nr:twin-arginine translocase subunit TatC [Anaerolineae bacterium]
MAKATPPAKSLETEDETLAAGNLTLLGHLNELRIRLTYVVVALLVTTLLSFAFAEPMLLYLLEPYAESINGEVELQTLEPTEGIETFFKVSLLTGAILSMPMILYQFWQFVVPGLTHDERRYVYIFLPSTLLLFALGILFAWFVLIPAAVFFLANFLGTIFKTDWTPNGYIGFVLRMLFWIGLAFEMPVIVYFVARVGVVTAKTLREQWRFAIVGIAVLAAIITPSIDPVTMMLTMAPLIVLYILSIGLAVIGQRQFERSVAID